MNVEAYSYVVVAALVGMGVVFFFLIVLSVLMVVIRFFFDRPAGDKPASPRSSTEKTGVGAAGSTAGGTTGGADVTDSGGVPRWAVAGALAYLATEEREYAPRSGEWTKRWTQRGQR